MSRQLSGASLAWKGKPLNAVKEEEVVAITGNSRSRGSYCRENSSRHLHPRTGRAWEWEVKGSGKPQQEVPESRGAIFVMGGTGGGKWGLEKIIRDQTSLSEAVKESRFSPVALDAR